MSKSPMTRRGALFGAAAALAAPTLLRAQTLTPSIDSVDDSKPAVRRNASSFTSQNWQDHFETMGKGCLLADITSRAVHYWGPDGTYLLYPSSVPRSEELTRRGYSEIVRKKVGPSWTPTKSMREANPDLPDHMEPGPGNPLGTHAMYLTWPAYLIHGTHDTRKIGRQSSSGCIGLYNENVAVLFEHVQIGTQVRLL